MNLIERFLGEIKNKAEYEVVSISQVQWVCLVYKFLPVILFSTVMNNEELVHLEKYELVYELFLVIMVQYVGALFLEKEYNKGFGLVFVIFTLVCLVGIISGTSLENKAVMFCMPLMVLNVYNRNLGAMYYKDKYVWVEIAYIPYYVVFLFIIVYVNPLKSVFYSYWFIGGLSDLIWILVNAYLYTGFKKYIKDILGIGIDVKKSFNSGINAIKRGFSSIVYNTMMTLSVLIVFQNSKQSYALMAYLVIKKIPVLNIKDGMIVQIKSFLVEKNRELNLRFAVVLGSIILYIELGVLFLGSLKFMLGYIDWGVFFVLYITRVLGLHLNILTDIKEMYLQYQYSDLLKLTIVKVISFICVLGYRYFYLIDPMFMYLMNIGTSFLCLCMYNTWLRRNKYVGIPEYLRI